MKDAYRDAGVDIAAGEVLVDRIRHPAASTARPEVLGGIGGFGGLFSLQGYRDPVLVSGTDGVGTKLLVAQRLGRHQTIGIDLVAMCVNDVVVTGAEPLFFLDYFATGKLDVDVATEVIEGIAAGCKAAGCALIGGETAEMPGMYGAGHYDLAGFCVGAVERDQILDRSAVVPGDALVGLPSSGIHSNGYSLVRKLVVDIEGFDPTAPVPGGTVSIGDTLLEPTRIYVKTLLKVRQQFGLKAAAHITGGGISGNLPRALPKGLGAELERDRWPKLPVFDWLAAVGGLSEAERMGTFNEGLGMILVVPQDQAADVAAASGGYVIGSVVDRVGVTVQ